MQTDTDYDKNYDVVLSLYDLTDPYIRHAAATIVSIASNTNNHIRIHLLYDKKESAKDQDLCERNKRRFESLENKYNISLYFHEVRVPEWFLNIPAMKKYHVGTLLRLFIPDTLTKVDKVLYLDCDVIVNLDIVELWNLDITGLPLAACLDKDFPSSLGLKYSIPKIKKIYDNTGYSCRYFNAGVLLLNLEYLRRHIPLCKFASEYLTKTPYSPFSDQDILNAYAMGKYCIMDEKYNKFSHYINKDDKNCIIHYCSSKKPWNEYSGEVDDYYWKYFINTPWAENKIEFINFIRDAPNVNTTFKLLSKKPINTQIIHLIKMTKLALLHLKDEIQTFVSYL